MKTLVNRRIQEAGTALGFVLPVTWDIGPYPHFRNERGFGVTFRGNDGLCHMRFAPKLAGEVVERQDGIVRHEIGHVADFLVPEKELDEWAYRRRVALPHTPERRADAIAEALWREPILYDDLTVQNTRDGVCPRPRGIGL